MKRWFVACLVGILMVSLIGNPIAMAAGPKWKGLPPGQAKKFLDSSETPWATEAIEKMAERKVIAGYPNGLFLPNKPVTQLEALIMAARVFGWATEDRADTVRQLMVYAKNKEVPAWAFGYIVLAVEKGILPDDLKHFSPNKPATRAQVAELIIKALETAEKETDQDYGGIEEFIAQWSEGQTVRFADEQEIPDQYRYFVGIMARLGLMQGYKGRFEPNKPVTRAQMAVLLYRLHLMIIKGDKQDMQEISGHLIGFDQDQKTVFIWHTQSKLVAIELTADIEIVRNDQPLAEDEWDELQIGDKVVVEKEDGKVVKITALAYRGKVEFTGRITDIDGEEITIELKYGASTAAFTYPVDNDVELADVAAGDWVDVVLQRGEVVDLDPANEDRDENAVSGVLWEKSSREVTLLTNEQKLMEYPLAEGYKVWLDRQLIGLGDLRTGETLQVTLVDGEVTEIKATTQKVTITGAVMKASLRGTDTLTSYVGGVIYPAMPVDDDCTVLLNGKQAALSELDPGDAVKLTLVRNNVIKIEAEKKCTAVVSGKLVIEALSEEDTITVSVNGSQRVYQLAAGEDDTPVYESGAQLKWDELKNGDDVTLYLNEEDEVLAIHVQ